MQSPSISFSSEEEAPGPKKARGVMIDLLADEEERVKKEEPREGRKDDWHAAKHEEKEKKKKEEKEEEESSSIDLHQFMVPLSEQRQQGLVGPKKIPRPRSVTPTAARPAKTAARKRSPKRKARPAAKKKAAKNAPVIESSESAEQVRAKAKPIQQAFSRSAGAAPAALATGVRPFLSAEQHFVELRRDACEQENQDFSPAELNDCLHALWLSLDLETRAPFLRLEEIDRQRYTAERRVANL